MLGVAFSGCDDHEQVVPPVCLDIADRCHELAEAGGSALAVECHELGHDGTQAECEMRMAECLAECPETLDAGPPDGAP